MKIVILRSAVEDLDRGYKFYEQKTAGLGDYFMHSLFSDIESLLIFAGIHRKVHGYHRLLSKRFPYAIYYRIEEESIRIRAVLDCRRSPDWISRKVD